MENKKTARELFEESGFRFGEDYYGNIVYGFYDEEEKKYLVIIKFELDNEKYSVRFYYDYFVYATFDMKLHKLITYQLKELGWLDE